MKFGIFASTLYFTLLMFVTENTGYIVIPLKIQLLKRCFLEVTIAVLRHFLALESTFMNIFKSF